MKKNPKGFFEYIELLSVNHWVHKAFGLRESGVNLEIFRGYQEKNDLEWLVQVLPYIDRLRGHPLVVVDYDLLIRDPKAQLQRIVFGLSLPIDDAIETSMRDYAQNFAVGDLYHHRHDPAGLREREELNPLTVETYLLLHRLATDDIGRDDPAFWSALGDLQERFEAMAPVLRYVDFLEEELKRRYFGLVGLWQKLQPRIGTGGRRKAAQAG